MVSGRICSRYYFFSHLVSIFFLVCMGVLLIVSPAVSGNLPHGASAIDESYQDWHLDCRNSEEGVKCTVSQKLLEGQSQQVFFKLEFTLMNSGQPHGLMVTPFGLNLVEGVTVTTEGETIGDVYAFSTCVPTGCEVPFDLDELQFKNFIKTETVKLAFTTLKGKVVNFQIKTAGLAEALERAALLMK